jgi:hypothetical protein
MKHETSKPKSPLKRKALRYAGQSLDERLDYLSNVRASSWILAPVFLWVFAGIEWVGKRLALPRSPLTYVIVAVLATALSTKRLLSIRAEIQNAKLGRDGERVVGQFLEELRSGGARVFHDIQADGFNLDHVVICTKGVFVVETKTWSKPNSDSKISIRNDQVMRNGAPVDRDAVGQVLGAADWTRRFLQESTAQRFHVHPVLLFPGWFVEPRSPQENTKYWALEPKAFPAFVSHQPDRISPSDVAMAAKHLSAWITR